MKIEKINENQIRCTLTREDLASRELKISELAYGTEKAKNLFRDMMQQANFEFGFEAEDIPLMIEAVPLNSECIVLIITKVEDPEELDTRFSRFAPSVTEDEDDYYEEEGSSDEIADLFRRLQDSGKHSGRATAAAETPAKEESNSPMRIFHMDSLQQVMNAAGIVGHYYQGQSALYKDEKSGKYLLVLTQGTADKAAFDRVCFCLSEYGSLQRSSSMNHVYLEEHFKPLVAENALQSLSGAN
ncbi:MAG: adaptor protein MecA [Lachnospiraceae bacterium]|nr:adaptor protein MecA [Lachnospiraceae bacterium]